MKHAKTSRILSLLALVLAVTMLLTLVGCGDDSGKNDDKKPSNDTTTTISIAPTGDANTDPSTDASTDIGDSSTDANVTDPSESNPSESDPTATEGTGADASQPTATKPTKTPTASVTKPTGNKQQDPSALLSKVPSKLKGTKIKMLIWWEVASDDTKEAKIFKEKTGIEVAYESAAMEKYQTTLSGKVMSGQPPALAAIINEWYPQPITRGLMQPISNTGWDYSDPIYAKAMMDQFGYKGVHYGIALKGSNMTTFEVMFFNKKLMKSNGVSKDPYQLWQAGQWNWETCLDIAKKCTNAKKDKYGMTLIYQNFWMLSAGQDFVLSDKNGLKNNLKSADLLNAWYYAWDMIKTHKVIPTMFNKQQTLFYDGSVAMLGGGSYFMQAEASHSDYVPQNMKDDWGVVPFPSPKGQSAVAACEGTVWGFPTKVKGNQLQAAMWFLRYYLDDSAYGARDFYPTEQCWDVMGWMWNQKIQSYNSVGVITYGGKHSSTAIQYKLIDDAETKSQISSNLEEWSAEIDANIKQIKEELD